MSHAQAANLLVRSYSSSSSQQRPPVPPATRRSNRRGGKGDAASQKQTSAASDGSTSEQQDANKKSNSFKEPDNAVIDTKPAYGDSPLVRHLKKSNAEQRSTDQREQWLKSSAGGDGDGDGNGSGAGFTPLGEDAAPVRDVAAASASRAKSKRPTSRTWDVAASNSKKSKRKSNFRRPAAEAPPDGGEGGDGGEGEGGEEGSEWVHRPPPFLGIHPACRREAHI